MIWVGIDTGVHTGFAIWDSRTRQMLSIETLMIHQAMQIVETLAKANPGNLRVRFEDARQRKWVPFSGDYKKEKGRAQGAGSVKRDCGIWEDFLADLKIPFEAVAPVHNATKMKADTFNQCTGWRGRTSEHGRDAAMLVFGKSNS